MTTYWQVPPDCSPEADEVREAAELLRQGRLVAFPTETVYGLGADARNTQAVEAIFTAKGRPSDNPLIVHIAGIGMLDELALSVDPVSRQLAEVFWPGPLTLVLPCRPGMLSPLVTAGLDTVGIRMPDHPVALSLIRASGCPVAAPSANRSGRPSPTLAEHVREDLDGRIDGLLDGGATGVGLESTVVQVDGAGRVHVLRPGGITLQQLAEASAAPVVRGGGEETLRPRAPGMKYTHYAPQARLTLVPGGEAPAVAEAIRRGLREARLKGEKTAVLVPAEHAHSYQEDADLVIPCGSLGDLPAAAAGLFAALRRMDEAGIDCAFAESYPEEDIGLAIMNRLRKAAGGRVLEV
ncbi:MAG: translation factor [Paenibacillaceae bacterium]|jgi:L-threonylcarbamoyladenylate synthase|nr:translation factor [Paenibacillaceae bacterium]